MAVIGDEMDSEETDKQQESVTDAVSEWAFISDECWTSMAKATSSVYLRHWLRFAKHASLPVNAQPGEKDFLAYLSFLHESGKAPTTIISIYSMLNKVMKIAFGKRLGVEWPKLPMFCAHIK